MRVLRRGRRGFRIARARTRERKPGRRERLRRAAVGSAAIAALLLAPVPVCAQFGRPLSPRALPEMAGARNLHEPVFGIGPHTTWRGGYGLEVGVESEGDERVFDVELLYGVTETLTLTVVLPFSRPLSDGSLGSVGLRAKWRLWSRFAPGLLDAVALVGGLTVPRSVAEGVEQGGPRLLAGATAGRESRRWYAFAGLRGTLATESGGVDPGDMLAADAAWGVRPVLSSYEAPDLVLLVELNARRRGASRTGPGETAKWNEVSLAPAFLFSYQNVMLKGGLGLVLHDSRGAPDESSDLKLLAAMEVHW